MTEREPVAGVRVDDPPTAGEHVFDHDLTEGIYVCQCGYVTANPDRIEAHAKRPEVPARAVRVWIDRQFYDFNGRIATGARLRRAAGIPDDHEIWYEAPTPDREDVRVPEDQGFALLQDARFYSSPKNISTGAAARSSVRVDDPALALLRRWIGDRGGRDESERMAIEDALYEETEALLARVSSPPEPETDQ